MSSKDSSHFWQKVSEQNRVYFWSIFTTGLVGFFSLWLGITIQDDINTKNARETQKLARYQMVQAVYPKFSQYLDTGGIVFFDLWEIYNNPSKVNDNDLKQSLLDYYSNNQAEFVETMKNSVNFMCDNRYFFNQSSQRRICSNNVSVLFGLRLLERNNRLLFNAIERWQDCPSLRDSLSLRLYTAYYAKNMFSYQDDAVDGITEKCKSLLASKTTTDTSAIIQNALYSFIFLPYIDNFQVYQSELVPGDDVSNHLWKHIWILLVCVVLSAGFCVFLLYHVFKINAFKKDIVRQADERTYNCLSDNINTI